MMGYMEIKWTTETRRREVRQIARCKACGFIQSRLVTYVTTTTRRSDLIKAVAQRIVIEGNPPGGVAHAGCSRTAYFIDVKGHRVDDIECGPKCRSSKGPSCECSCGGKNHGAGYGHDAHEAA